MSTPVDTTFVRRNGGNFPIVADTDVQGGLQSVADTTARDAIPTNLRKEGMLVYSQADDTYYQLEANLTTWVPFSGGSGGGLPDPTGHANQFLQVLPDASGVAWVTLTQDDIQPGFSASLSNPSTPVEVGATVTDPSFTASYSHSAAAATLNDGAGAIALTTPFTAFAYDGSGPLPARTYTKTTVNGSVTWTLSATDSNSVNKTATATVTWEARAYFDAATPPGSLDASFITSLTGNALEAGFARTISFGAGGGTKKLYYAFPASFGAPSRFIDVNSGFAVPFSKVASAVALTNTHGVVISGGYDIWASDQFLDAAVTVQVS